MQSWRTGPDEGERKKEKPASAKEKGFRGKTEAPGRESFSWQQPLHRPIVREFGVSEAGDETLTLRLAQVP